MNKNYGFIIPRKAGKEKRKMTKQELVRDMKTFSGGGFMTRQQLMVYMGYKDPHKVDKYLREIPSINKRYFIPDVAANMLDQI